VLRLFSFSLSPSLGIFFCFLPYSFAPGICIPHGFHFHFQLLGFAGHFSACLWVGGRLKLFLSFLLHAMLDGWVKMEE